MKIVIFGASGTVGRQMLPQAFALNHDITAFARDAGKLQQFRHKNLRVLEGDVFRSADVERAIAGCDAVICALGDGRKGKVRAMGTERIIEAMEKTGVRRLICQSTLGAGDSKADLNFFWRHIMFGWLLKKAYQDHEAQEKLVRASSLDWTIVRPAAFTDGEVTGIYKHGFLPGEPGLRLKIARADVAHFLLNQLMTDAYMKKTPGISY